VENAENLRRVTQLREDLSKMIIHDLRNPVSVIFSSMEMLDIRESKLPETKRKHYLEMAKASCSEILVLLNNLLELQKIEAGKLELRLDRLKPGEIARHVVNSLQVRAEIAGKSLACDIADHLPEVEVDREFFTRVLQNLVINAIKFTERGGHIHIFIERAADDAGVLFSVQDDGPGIPPGEQKNIFDKFTTLKSHKSNIPWGTGLGLTFCREITLAHKGAIWVESSVGKGSTFHVLLPIKKQ